MLHSCTAFLCTTQTRLELDERKASDYLRRYLVGDPSIKTPRLAFALQHMYDTDAEFGTAVDIWLSERAAGKLGAGRQLASSTGTAASGEGGGSMQQDDQQHPELESDEENAEQLLPPRNEMGYLLADELSRLLHGRDAHEVPLSSAGGADVGSAASDVATGSS